MLIVPDDVDIHGLTEVPRMKIVEVRDLDGPNIFLRQPAIKLEVTSDGDVVKVSEAAQALVIGKEPGSRRMVTVDAQQMLSLIEDVVTALHDKSDVERPEIVSRSMEADGHYAVAFSWSHRRFAEALGNLALAIVVDPESDPDAGVENLKDILASEPEDDDEPEMVRNADRTIPIVAITGTNGKTTTSRLISFVLRNAGMRTGLTSSTGVYIDQEQVIAGDYSGPSGAHRVLGDDRVEVAVLETARGGILLRGLGYEESDVSVVTNISADHLGLQGVYSIEELARVKSTVPRMTREGGFAVLNADDPRVLAMRDGLRARSFLVSRQEPTSDLRKHIDSGGWALTVEGGEVRWWHDGESDVLTTLNDIPMTFGGKAPHMVENALCAAAACLALGLDANKVRDGLAAFRSSSRDNHGRLNVYTLNGATIVLDFAHNEAGLKQLLSFSRHFVGENGELVTIIGTAGDREDSMFRAFGEIAARTADRIIMKDTIRYLRGREPGEMLRLMREGVEATGSSVETDTAPSEREACLRAFGQAGKGDVVAVMCIEDYDYLLDHLDSHGEPVS